MSDDDPKPELKQTIDERARWVNDATDLALSEGATGIRKAIDALLDDQLRGMLFVLVMARADDLERLQNFGRAQVAREEFDRLDSHGSITVR